MIKKQTLLLLFLLPLLTFAQTEIRVTDADIPAGSNVEWTADNIYILDGLVFVDSAATLTIEAGTIIKAEDGQDTQASGLVVTRHAQIFAEGTVNKPIIFTSVNDDLAGSLAFDDRGEWGGVVILGLAPTNNDGQKSIEGVNEIDPERAKFGGDEFNHNSGVFRYVSIRHTGINIGSSTGNEIQGLTCGGVGAGTTIEFVESYASDDDGFEFFGGTVNTKYLVSAFCSDDAFDWDQGFNGKHQFWFAIQASDLAGRTAEMDGAGGNDQGTPFATPVISNVTYIGPGSSATPDGDGDEMLYFRDNSGGKYYNSIFTQYNGGGGGLAITIEDVDNSGEKVEDSRKRLEAGDLALQNNLWWDFAAGNTVTTFSDQDFVQAYLSDAANSNRIENPSLRGVSRTTDQGLDPRPAANSPALAGSQTLADSYFAQTSYVGAFGTNNWLKKWTALDQLGYVAEETVEPGTIVITDDDIPAGADVTWTKDNIYILDGMVFVDSAATLTIEAGTVIKAEDGQDTEASGLVVTWDAQIFAFGTAAEPIIFTSVNDELNGNLDFQDRGEWGGVVILGKAPTNNDGVKSVEGVNEIDPVRARYGGDQTDHNSGVFRYVSIRHTGINIGSSTGNEIQGLTCGGVGAGTRIEYVESYASDDDGFEFFGGTVNTRYLISAFCSDDAFDWDQGFNGKHQFWFAIQGPDLAGRAAEMDGAGGNDQGTPFAIPMVANATYIGPGSSATPDGDGDEMLYFRDNSGGKYYNSIFTQYNGGGGGLAITIEDVDNSGEKVEDSRKRLEAGDLVLQNNLWWDFAAGNTVTTFSDQDFVQAYLSDAANSNRVSNPALINVSRTTDQGLDPRPAAGSPALTGAKDLDDDFFIPTDYVGAFGRKNWMLKWTALDQLGYLTPFVPQPGTRVITDADIPVGANVTFSADTTYILDGMVFVDQDATLIIEEGTVIKAEDGQDTEASGLTVTRDGKIFAEGTRANPIIFTSINDNLDGNLSFDDRGEWGGVVILGKAPTNNDGDKSIEGVNEIDPERAKFGGSDPDHSSGVFRYVSIRHTGINIGSSTGNEIQGLTCGGVGAGTTIEWVESYSSDDDGFEFFGGTVNTKYLVSAFCSDDAFDWDQGFNGKHQFWFAIQASDLAGRAAEMDGAGGNDQGTPFAIPMLSNVTYIGPGSSAQPDGDGDEMLYFRDNTGGKYYNSIFTQYNGGGGGLAITIEDVDNSGEKVEDSRKRLEAGDLALQNNLWWDFAAGNTVTTFSDQDFAQAYLGDAANANKVGDPLFRGVSRTTDGGLDPRVALGSPALSGAKTLDDDYFTQTSYLGAFGDENWLTGWTALDELGYVGELTDVEDSEALPTSYALSQNYPNPFNPSTTIRFALPEAANVKLTVYNILGQQVAQLVNELRTAGTHNVVWNASDVSTGIYIYRLEAGTNVITKKMTLIK